jgi:glycosyltransferase involved in cell wall biosynthesis
VDLRRVTVVPRGREFDEDLLSHHDLNTLKAELQMGEANPILLSVGRLIRQKGHCYAIAAMPKICERFPQARLLIVGDGELRESLQDIASQLGVAGRVQFLGTRNDVPKLLQLADLFVFPSLYEGFPGAVVEAMLAGRCVVCSDIPMMDGLVQDGVTGLRVHTADPMELAAAIINLAEDVALRDRLATAGRIHARCEFQLQSVVSRMEDLFEDVAQGRFSVTAK